jgi:hypothetical protein
MFLNKKIFLKNILNHNIKIFQPAARYFLGSNLNYLLLLLFLLN